MIAVLQLPPDTRLFILAPVVRHRKGAYRKELEQIKRDGFVRVRIDDEVLPLETIPQLDRNFNHTIEIVVDRLVVRSEMAARLTNSVETALAHSDGLVGVQIVDGEHHLYSVKHACPDCGFSCPELEPRLFSFNSPQGACTTCDGLGVDMEFDPELVVPHDGLSLNEGAVVVWSERYLEGMQPMLRGLEAQYGVDLQRPFGRLSEEQKHVVLYGSGDEPVQVSYRSRGRDAPRAAHIRRRDSCAQAALPGYGIPGGSRGAAILHASEAVQRACQGTRLRP